MITNINDVNNKLNGAEFFHIFHYSYNHNLPISEAKFCTVD